MIFYHDFFFLFSFDEEIMVKYQEPRIVTLTLDKEKIFDYVKLLFADPEKVDLNVDDLLKSAAVGDGGGQDVVMQNAEAKNDYEEKVLKIHYY